MEIDIISYTPTQYAALTEEQLLEVKSAQLKKNRLTVALEEDLQKEKHRLVKNGIFLSSIWDIVQSKLRAAYNQEVENLRDGLLFYLRYSAKPSDSEVSKAPYVVDYSLTETERLEIVKTYYENTYTDGKNALTYLKTIK